MERATVGDEIDRIISDSLRAQRESQQKEQAARIRDQEETRQRMLIRESGLEAIKMYGIEFVSILRGKGYVASPIKYSTAPRRSNGRYSTKAKYIHEGPPLAHVARMGTPYTDTESWFGESFTRNYWREGHDIYINLLTGGYYACDVGYRRGVELSYPTKHRAAEGFIYPPEMYALATTPATDDQLYPQQCPYGFQRKGEYLEERYRTQLAKIAAHLLGELPQPEVMMIDTVN